MKFQNLTVGRMAHLFIDGRKPRYVTDKNTPDKLGQRLRRSAISLIGSGLQELSLKVSRLKAIKYSGCLDSERGYVRVIQIEDGPLFSNMFEVIQIFYTHELVTRECFVPITAENARPLQTQEKNVPVVFS